MDLYDDEAGLYLPESVLLGERRDRVVERIFAADQRYVPHLCPIYTYFDNAERGWKDYAELEGTATAINCKSRYLLVTAEHVVRDKNHAERRIGLVMDGLLEPLPSVPLYVSRDPDDFAIIELDAETAARLTNVSFLKLEDEPARQQKATGRQLTFVGLPCSRNKINNRSNTIPPLHPVSVRTTGVKGRGVGTFHASFARKTARYADGTLGCPDLHGISGGPVLEHAFVGDAVSTRLMGITVEIDGEKMVGHDLRYILSGWESRAAASNVGSEVQ